MLHLNDEDKKNLELHDKNYDIYTMINEKKYYFKPITKIGTELIAERLANKVGINSAHYEIAEGYDYYFSEDIAGKDEFLPASQALGLVRHTSLYDIWSFVEKEYPNNVEEIMQEVVKIYLFDIILNHPDRHRSNWGIKLKNGEFDKVYILDNELIFNDYNDRVLLTSNINPDIEELELYTETHDNMDLFDNISELNNFLDTSSKEYIDLFLNMYNDLNPTYVNTVIDDVVKELESNGKNMTKSEHIRESYNKYYNNIRKLLESKNLIITSKSI